VTEEWVPDLPPRPLTDWERGIVELLAPHHDPDALRVYEHCTCCSSISFVPQLRPHSFLAEAETFDIDGMYIWFSLFGSRDGSELDELEIQRGDGGPLRSLPHPSTVTLGRQWSR
jgi:hypothetical protein